MTKNHANKSLWGMVSIAAAVFLFSVTNAVIKDSAARYPINQIVFFRFFFSLFPVAIIMLFSEGKKGFKTTHIFEQFARGALGTLGLGCLFYSFANLPLANATAVSFSVALFASLLAIPLLKEYPEPSKWLSLILGFLGVLFVVKPQGSSVSLAAGLCVLAALIDSVSMTTGRYLATRCDVGCGALSFYFGVVATLLSGITLFFCFEMPTASDLGLFCFMGVAGGVGQYLITLGFILAPAAVASVTIYTAIVWSLLIGYFFWGDVPTSQAFLGIFLIVGSGAAMALLQRRSVSKEVDGTES